MIIWRGLGFLAVLLMLGGMALGMTVLKNNVGVGLGVGILVGAVLSFALGWYLNVIAPAKKVDEWSAQRAAELSHQLQQSHAQAGQQVTAADVSSQVSAQVAAESTVVAKKSRNIHTVFWIPMQWFAVVGAALGVLLIVAG